MLKDSKETAASGSMSFTLSEINRRSFLARSAGVGATAMLGGGLLAACGDDDEETGGTGTGGGAQAVGKNTVRLALAGEVRGFDPIGASQGYVPSLQARAACCDSLVSFRVPKELSEITSPEASVQPQLAESWETSEDGNTFTFKLRQGVMSPFGNEMTSEDVVWSLHRCIAGEGAAASQLRLNNVTTPEQIKAIDEYTVEVSSEGQYRLLQSMGFLWFTIIDSTEAKTHATEKDEWATEWLDKNTAGFGPYVIESVAPGGTEVRFKAREDYWGEKPIETVIYKTVTDSSTALQLLLTGEADYAENLAPEQLSTLSENDKTGVVNIASANGALFCLTYEAPWDDVKLRQAVAKALPYDAVINTVYKGLDGVQRNKSILAPFVEGHTDEFGYDTDMEAARAELASVQGEKLEFVYNGDIDVARQISVLIQTALNEAGLDVSIRALPRAQFETEIRAKKWPSSVNTFDFPAYVDAYYGFTQILSAEGTENFSGYKSDEAEALIEKVAADPHNVDLIKEGQMIAMRDLPLYPLAWTGDHRGVAKGLDILGSHTAVGVVYWQDLKWTE